ncbi:MAG: hypothetical protein QXD62_01870 [Candidatus Woesearchaeota archaeon]
MKKKGLSSLIITVLLVAISIGLGSMVIGWVTTTVSSQISSARPTQMKLSSCQEIKFTVWKTYLYSNGTHYNNFTAFIQNDAHDIVGFVTKITDSTGNLVYVPSNYITVNQETYLSAGDRKWISFYCDKCAGNISFVELIPLYRDSGGNLALCDMNIRTYDGNSIEKK